MKDFKSTINNKSASFRNNKEAMKSLVSDLDRYLKISHLQGNEIALENDLKISIDDIKEDYKKWLKEYMVN